MAQKEHLLFKSIVFCCLIISMLSMGCFSKSEEQSTKLVVEKVDISNIPFDTASITQPALKLENGIYYLNAKPFSGFIKDNGGIQGIISIAVVLPGHAAWNHHILFMPMARQRDERNVYGKTLAMADSLAIGKMEIRNLNSPIIMTNEKACKNNGTRAEANMPS